jgi:hypothetical protein
VKEAVAQVPTHQDFINQYCRAHDDVWGQRRPNAA